MTRAEIVALFKAKRITAERFYHLCCNLEFNKYPHQPA